MKSCTSRNFVLININMLQYNLKYFSIFFLILYQYKLLIKTVSCETITKNNPLFLTPYIENGEIELVNISSISHYYTYIESIYCYCRGKLWHPLNYQNFPLKAMLDT